MSKSELVVISCEWCGETIPPEKVKKKGMRNPPKYCCRSHANKARPREFFQRLGKAGNAAQALIKERTGRKPGYEKRSKAVADSNRKNPRRKKKVS
jgi:hypothetical protein